MITKSKFLGGLPPAIARQVNIHMANADNATLDQIVKLSTILESERGCAAVTATQHIGQFVETSVDPYLGWNNSTDSIPQLMTVAAQAPVSDAQQLCYVCRANDHFARDCPTVKETRCFNCQELGHIARNCKSK